MPRKWMTSVFAPCGRRRGTDARRMLYLQICKGGWEEGQCSEGLEVSDSIATLSASFFSPLRAKVTHSRFNAGVLLAWGAGCGVGQGCLLRREGASSPCRSGRASERASERLRDRVTDGGVTGAFDYMPSSQPEGRRRGGGRGRPTWDVHIPFASDGRRVRRMSGRARVTASSSLVCEARRRDANRRKEEKGTRFDMAPDKVLWESHTRQIGPDKLRCALGAL